MEKNLDIQDRNTKSPNRSLQPKHNTYNEKVELEEEFNLPKLDLLYKNQSCKVQAQEDLLKSNEINLKAKAEEIKKNKQMLDELVLQYEIEEELKNEPINYIFSWNQFFEFYFYYLIQYLFWPFSLVIIALINNKSLIIPYNLKFLGWKPAVLKNIFISLLMQLMLIIAVTQINEFKQTYILYICEVLLLFQNIILYQSISFGKYFFQLVENFILCLFLFLLFKINIAFMNKQKYNNIKTKIMKEEQCQQDLELTTWREQSTKFIEEEFQNAMDRNDVDNSLFYFEFLVQPSHNKMDQLQNPQAPKNPIIINQTQYFFSDLAFGPNLAREYLQYYKKNLNQKKVQRLAVQLMYIPIYLLLIIFKIVQENIFNNNYDIVEIVFLTGIAYLFFTFIKDAYLFVVTALQDINRKIFLMNQLGYLISPRKVELYDDKKLYPTLNITCAITLRNWIKLRILFNDYGQKFYNQWESLIGFFLALDFFLFIGITINAYYKFVKIQLSQHFELVYLAGLWTIFLLYFVKQGAQVNQSYKEHKLLLMNNLSMINEVNGSSCMFDRNKQVFENHIFRELLSQMHLLFFKRCSKQANQLIKKKQKEIIQQLRFGLEQVEFLEQNSSLKCAGQQLTNDLFIKIILSLISMIIAITIKDNNFNFY